MSAVPKKKRRGRPRGSKNKPKVAMPSEIKEALQPYQQDIVAGLESDNPVRITTPESSFVAGYFGLDKIEQPVQDELPDSEYRRIYDETIAPVIERLEQEEAGDLHAGIDWADPDTKDTTSVFLHPNVLEFKELKSILRQIDAKVKDLASYPMDHGLRCGMNEVEILLANNREKFSK